METSRSTNMTTFHLLRRIKQIEACSENDKENFSSSSLISAIICVAVILCYCSMPFLLFVNFFVIIVLCLLRYNDTRTSEGVCAVNKGGITCIIDSHYEFLFLNYIHSVFLHIVPRVWETVIFYPCSARS
jgi:hypothetical protein